MINPKDDNRDKYTRSNRFDQVQKQEVAHKLREAESFDENTYKKELRKEIVNMKQQKRRNLSNNSTGRLFDGNSRRGDKIVITKQDNEKARNKVQRRMEAKKINEQF